MEFSDLASVSGKGGLFKVVSPTRNGVILEPLDDDKKKFIAGIRTKVSVLSDISIYTVDGEGSTPLEEVMKKIHKEFDGDTGLSGTSDAEELKSFLKHILPNYDDSKVYVSDIKKLISWYGLIARDMPELLAPQTDDAEPSDQKVEQAQDAAPNTKVAEKTDTELDGEK